MLGPNNHSRKPKVNKFVVDISVVFKIEKRNQLKQSWEITNIKTEIYQIKVKKDKAGGKHLNADGDAHQQEVVLDGTHALRKNIKKRKLNIT